MRKIKLKNIRADVLRSIGDVFPERLSRMTGENSYFRYVYSLLCDSSSFLEIGYRWGVFVNVCGILKVNSEHVDICDKRLRVKSNKNNKVITTPSIDYLTTCDKRFDLVFQDGSKDYQCRVEEYDLIIRNNLLKSNAIVIVDDLHYKGCKKAFNYAIDKYGFKSRTAKVTDKREKGYKMGFLYLSK